MTTQSITTISNENLISEVIKLKDEGYRLVQICATTVNSEYEITYSFALDYEFLCIRLMIPEEAEIMSISQVFAPAFLYENEMKDLFGIKINALSLDYQGNFYRLEQKTPYKNQ
ncbi:MAG: echD [Oscillospiraceae bacterium]|jgi:ech hydrogenase subunit D|nr:echD [Oscillospiraceae bacterium]